MKDFILKNKKIVCIVLGGISILFIILAIFNLTGTKRAAYKSMYDANNELYESYIDVAEKFERYGYSSKAQSYYSNAYELEDKLERYKSKMAGLNVQLGLYVALTGCSIFGAVVLLKGKKEFNCNARSF